jgi:hypothetical protein
MMMDDNIRSSRLHIMGLEESSSQLASVNSIFGDLLFTSCWGWLVRRNVLGVSRCGVGWSRVSWSFVCGSFVSSVSVVVFPVVFTVASVSISPLDLFEYYNKT